MSRNILVLIIIVIALFVLGGVFQKAVNAEPCMNNGAGKVATNSNGDKVFIPHHQNTHHKMEYVCKKA